MGNRMVPLTEAERAMKIQEIILRAMAGELKWYQAAEILDMSERQLRRWRKRYQEHGYDGLFDRRRQSPSPRRIPYEVVQQVLRLYRTEYRGYNVKHFHEEITEERGIKVSYSWTKDLLQEAGLVQKAKKRGVYRRRRPRKVCAGMMLHLDGSEHRWFQHPDHERQCLVVALDDATSEIVAAKFAPEETSQLCLEVVREVVSRRGTFGALYTDRASHFVYTPRAGGKPDRSKPTQLEQILEELGTELIVAYSPEARGRGERMFGTLQGRLPMELRRAGARSYEEANTYLRQVYLTKHNRQFSVEAAEASSAYLPVRDVNLDRVFARRFERVVRRDNTVEFQCRHLQLPKVEEVSTLARRKVEVREHLDGTLEVLVGKRLIAAFEPHEGDAEEEREDRGEAV